MQSRLAAGLIERAAQHLAIDRHHPLQLLRELPHKPLKGIAKLIRIKIAKQPAEGVMAGQAVGQGEKAAQKWLFGLSEESHIYRTLTAAQHAAQSDHQQFAKVMQRGIPVARILQPFPTGTKLLQRFFARHEILLRETSCLPDPYVSGNRGSAQFQMRLPCFVLAHALAAISLISSILSPSLVRCDRQPMKSPMAPSCAAALTRSRPSGNLSASIFSPGLTPRCF